VDNLALLEPGAEGVESIQLAFVYARPRHVVAREIKRVREDDAEGGTEGCHHVQPGKVWRCAYIVQSCQNRIPGAGGRGLQAHIACLSVGGILDRRRNYKLRYVPQSKKLGQPVAEAAMGCKLTDGARL
jgi:hypothetical protein